MRTSIHAGFVALVALCCAVCSSGQNGVIKSPVSVSISAPETVKLGSPIMLHIALRNESASAVTFSQERHSGQEGEFNYQVFVSFTDGGPVPDTDYGKKIRSHSLVRSGSSIILRLEPGKEISEDLDLTKLTKVSLLGTYVVHVERDSPPPLNVSSNSLRIRVEP
jgi:hypothetical protein